ncbi:uncharacterized protein FA14DRAFT_110789, partial [Meira miltonrushii]
MADLYSRNVNTKFSGLTTTVALFGVVGGLAIVGFETLRQMRRLPKTRIAHIWKEDKLERQGGRGGVDPKGDDKGGNSIASREKLTCEDWEMGHLYLARQFHHTTPSPPMWRWPFSWAYQALKFDDWFYATHTGMDTVVYVRFLRACMFWILLQTLTTAPLLLAVHFHFAVESNKAAGQSTSLNDMSQASLSYLVTTTLCKCPDGRAYRNCDHVPNEDGRKLLWIHLILLWYITFTWFYALWWIAKGSIRIRRRWINEIRIKRQEAVEANAKRSAIADDADQPEAVVDARYAPDEHQNDENFAPRHVLEEKHGFGSLVRGDDHDGWRQRTLLVTNLPPTMRDEASIRRYFEEFLRPDDASSILSSEEDEGLERSSTRRKASTDDREQQNAESNEASTGDTAVQTSSSNPDKGESPIEPAAEGPQGPEPDVHPDRHLRSPVQTVVLVRKMNELSSMLSRRQEVLAKLEAAHIKLAQTVMLKVGRNAQSMRSKNAKNGGQGGLNGLGRGYLNRSRLGRKRQQEASEFEDEKGKTNGDVENEAGVKLSETKVKVNELTRKLARFSPNNQGLHKREAQTRGDDEVGGNEMAETVWEALSQVPRELLDPFQPVTRLSSLFRGQKVPTIDYLLTKLNLLTALVTEMRARPPTSYEATSTAFVTFRDPRQARMVWRELKTQIVVKVRLAPEVKDLDWERLMRTSFTGDIVRGVGVNVFFWVFTIVWVIPVSLLTTSLFSVDKLEAIFPVLNTFFKDNPKFEGFVSVTLPTMIVTLLTLLIPELIFQISKRAQGFVTFSALYDQCLCRYWKFIICNVVIFFCIGATTVQSIIFQLGTDNNVLNAVAFSFPTAAPFYISYLILGLGVHTGFELLGFMVPLIQHMGARNASTPRSRAIKTLPRNFNRYYWLPLHILIMSIVFLFALLNPLVIPFALVYSWVALTVFKKNFAYQYFRRFNEKEGVIYYIRLFRFTLDGLLIAQVVLLIFFSVTKQEAAYIALTAVLLPINVGVKLLGTRLWKSQCRALEDEEANALCGIGSSEPMSAGVQRDYVGQSSMYGQAEDHSTYANPLDARASGRYPAIITMPESKSRFANLWNRLHDSFNANGYDRPSYLATQRMHGRGLSAKTVTQAVASAPVNAAKKNMKKSRHLAEATKNVAAVPASGFKLRKQLAVSSTFPAGKSDEEIPISPSDMPLQGGPLIGASARELKNTLDGTEEPMTTVAKMRAASKKHGRISSHHHRRQRSDEAPFLSGYETIATHAPIIGSDNGSISSYGDGEYEEMLSLQRREYAAEHRRRRSHARRSASHGKPSRTFSQRLNLQAGDLRDPLGAHTLDEQEQTDHLESEPNSAVTQSDDLAGKTKLGSDEVYEKDDEDDYEDSMDGGPLVKPHTKVQWDDTPNNHARYNNPFYSVELDPFLWLPRDPMAPVDLCDTIEWHGPALVSSQGGLGRMGEWEEDEDEESECVDEEGGYELEDGASVRSIHSNQIHGNEHIEITGTLAQRIQEAEDLDDTADPAASIPRNLLGDYKRALDENE